MTTLKLARFLFGACLLLAPLNGIGQIKYERGYYLVKEKCQVSKNAKGFFYVKSCKPADAIDLLPVPIIAGRFFQKYIPGL